MFSASSISTQCSVEPIREITKQLQETGSSIHTWVLMFAYYLFQISWLIIGIRYCIILGINPSSALVAVWARDDSSIVTSLGLIGISPWSIRITFSENASWIFNVLKVSRPTIIRIGLNVLRVLRMYPIRLFSNLIIRKAWTLQYISYLSEISLQLCTTLQ